jgi:hypothetical protein
MALVDSLRTPDGPADARLRSGDEATAMRAAREIVSLGKKAVMEQNEKLAFEFQNMDPEVRRCLTLGLASLVAEMSHSTVPEVLEWSQKGIEESHPYATRGDASG